MFSLFRISEARWRGHVVPDLNTEHANRGVASKWRYSRLTHVMKGSGQRLLHVYGSQLL